MELYRTVLEAARVVPLAQAIDARYREIDADRTDPQLPPGERFAPTASSVTLGAVLTRHDVEGLITRVRASAAGAWITRALGGVTTCDLDEAWVRRQYAPGRYPALHAPHGWHQDGGLAFDYVAHPAPPFPPDAMLTMATCWIALAPCGMTAPALELIAQRPGGLLAVTELTDARVRARYGEREFRRPVLETGDALVFAGDVVHRTHVTPGMTQDRTSIELRFFRADAVPVRLASHRFVTPG